MTDIGLGLDLLNLVEEPNEHESAELQMALNEMNPVNLKIADGRPSVPGSWAWVAQIKYWRNGRYEFVCAGTLIADRWILTAAQCLSDEYLEKRKILFSPNIKIA